ncbi:MAG: sulfate adenylyltransferase subunit CysN [Bryobacterales bacterium]|nr:sulfate adenylyltransferase subunit CysN [Bryobacterales bacterium]
MNAAAAPATIEEFLARHEASELLRFSTAGSVDDGKSTLIGRLLYDCKSVYEDQLASVKNSKINRANRPIDFSLLTDGLKAEREQGITIDVAYRYFSTPRRKFIIADTPGHEQYTRNMATGASTAHLAVILVDARHGLLPQSRRHTYISWLLGIPQVAVAVNKMDLVNFDQDVFRRIEADFTAFAGRVGLTNFITIPMSALDGDNVVARSEKMPWYSGPTLLEHLETVPVMAGNAAGPLRLPVQYVVRPDLHFRGFSGQLASGTVRPGDKVIALPSGRTSRVTRLAHFDGDLAEAHAPMSVCVALEHEIDISRGDVITTPGALPHVSRRFNATLVWMNAQELKPGATYLLKHTAQRVNAQVRKLRYRVNVNSLEQDLPGKLELNEIGSVEIEATRPLFFDSYRNNRWMGSFILIDPVSNATLAAGMIEEPAEEDAPKLEFRTGPVTREERYARAGHLPVTVWLTARKELASLLERRLFDRGCMVQALEDEVESHLLPGLSRLLNRAGLIVVCSSLDPAPEGAIAFAPDALAQDDLAAVDEIVAELDRRGIFLPPDFSSAEGI